MNGSRSWSKQKQPLAGTCSLFSQPHPQVSFAPIAVTSWFFGVDHDNNVRVNRRVNLELTRGSSLNPEFLQSSPDRR